MIVYDCHIYYIFFIILLIKKLSNNGFPNTNEMIELWKKTFYENKPGLDTVLQRLQKLTVL